jgi:hypothetical protein
MSKYKKKDPLALLIFLLLIIPTFVISVGFFSHLTGLLLFITCLFISLWVSSFFSGVISIYFEGKSNWYNESNNYGLLKLHLSFILLYILMGVLALGTLFIGEKKLSKSKKNLFKSVYYSFLISSISIVPYIVLIFLLLLFIS